METGKQLGNEIRWIYKKYRISGNMAKCVKQKEKAGKNGHLIKPGNENKNNEEFDWEDNSATQEIQSGSNREAAETKKMKTKTVAIMPLQHYKKQRYTCLKRFWDNAKH